MASVHRLRILALLLDGEMTPGAIGEALAENRFLVSRHLRSLRDVRLIRLRYRGRRVNYSLAGERASRLVREVVAYGERRSEQGRGASAGPGPARNQPPDFS
jgi:DNA-binding transcriptional ArsR family regulator